MKKAAWAHAITITIHPESTHEFEKVFPNREGHKTYLLHYHIYVKDYLDHQTPFRIFATFAHHFAAFHANIIDVRKDEQRRSDRILGNRNVW